MLDPKKYSFCSEFYIVEKTVEVVVSINGEAKRIRIEALHAPDSITTYSTQAYIEETTTIQPAYPQERGKYVREPVEVELWIVYDLPWTSGNSADEVIAQALLFLEERCK